MNWDIIKGQWKEMMGDAKRQWGKLTDDDLTRMEGDRDKLVGAVQKQYGKSKDEAEREVEDWQNRHS
jgi:uncharacterized protein YjbJ (UPF0337 family)